MSWAMRPSSGGGIVPASRRKARGSAGASAVIACHQRRPKTSAQRIGHQIVEGLKEPPSPPRDIPSTADVDALEQALVVSIRTAGLKPGRENQLVDEATRLRRRRKAWLEETEIVLREWIGHANLLWELHKQGSTKFNESRRAREKQHARSMANLKKELEDERERIYAAVSEERNASVAQLRVAQEAQELWAKARQEEAAAAAQREINRTTARLRRDAEQHARSVKETLEAEYADRMAAAIEQSEEAAALSSTAQKKATRLEATTRRLEAQLVEAAERNRRMERLSQTQNVAVQELKEDLENRARRLARRLDEEQASSDKEREVHASELLAVKQQWKEELRTVDDRVRTIVGVKDQAIERLTEGLEDARQRAETAEALLEELQRGICPTLAPAAVPGGLVEGYKRHQAATYHAFTAEEVGTIRVGLLSWYDKNRRLLPWRGDPPPWTRTAAPASASGTSTAAVRKKPTAAARLDPGQPRLTSFFGSKPKQPGASTNASDVTSGRGNNGSRSSGSNGVARKRKKAEADNVQDGNDEEQHESLNRIPMTAYGTWVSEVMLQQTRVETVVDYYVKWMALFPTPKALAEADLEQVNKAWAGLGYYRRAKMLHLGAQKVLADHGGSLPRTARELRDLPGIGPYTAGAVASIAFGECEPLVDGNVIRVLSRLKAIASDPKNAGLNKLCWDLAGSIVDPQRPGDFNQALMELGATVCTAQSPDCSACPVKASCLAYKLTAAGAGEARHLKPETAPAESSGTPTGAKALQARPAFPSSSSSFPPPCRGRAPPAASPGASREGAKCGCTVCEVGEDGMAAMPEAVTDFPRKAAKTLVKDQVLSVSVVERNGPEDGPPQILLVKRPETGLLAGQWECPCVILRDGLESTTSAEDDAGARAKKKPHVPEASVPERERVRAADALLFSELGLSKALVRSRAGVGSATHIFSHLRHTMQVERIILADDPDIDDNASTSSVREVRWVDVADMGGCGITTGMKKVLALANKARSGGAGPSAAIKQGMGTKAGAAGKIKKRKGKEDPVEGGKKALERVKRL
eukprot:g12451.t1